MLLIFATQNKNKAAEIQKLVPSRIQVKTLIDIGCQEDIPETAETLEGNAQIKAAYVWENYGENCFADDTGLEVEVLNGEPGVMSARYAGSGKNSDDNMNLLLQKLAGQPNRKAQFRTVISLIIDNKTFSFEGIVEGEITKEKAGKEGFGYDPIFKPNGFDKTFSEMSMDEKNSVSHRGQAIKKLVEFLENYKES